jgi:tetratricopeptide (TPR) repeat protein
VKGKAASLARAALALSRYEEAATHAAHAITEDPNAADGYGLLAQAELGLEQPRRAIKTAERGLAQDPESEWLHRLRSIALRLSKKHKDALAAADEAVRLAPHIAQCHYVRAQALAACRRPKEGIAAAERALELNPNDASNYSLLADLHLKKSPARAEEYYRKSLSIDPQSAPALNNLGVALLRQKRPIDAATAFKSAVLVDPTLTVAKRNAHATTSSLLRGGGLFGLVIVLQVLARSGAAHHDSGTLVAGAAVLALSLAVMFLVRRWRGRRNRASLERADPQLLRIYEKLDADKKAGRL